MKLERPRRIEVRFRPRPLLSDIQVFGVLVDIILVLWVAGCLPWKFPFPPVS